MSESLSDLITCMGSFEPSQLREALLAVREQIDQREPPPADGAAERPSFDELEAWLSARSSRERADQRRVEALLGEHESAASDEGRGSPLVVPVGLERGRAAGTVELYNDTRATVRVRFVAGHGALRAREPVAVELRSSTPTVTLGAGEARGVELSLRVASSGPEATTLVPVEVREHDEILARLWLEAIPEQRDVPEAWPRITLRRDLGPELRSLARLRRALLVHPRAARALYGALVAEGRRFARTEEGQPWAARLAASARMRRLRLAWEVVSLSVLDGAEHSEEVPSAWLDALFAVAGHADMEQALEHVSALSRES